MKRLFLITMVFVLPALMIGCATTGDLQKVQAEQKMIDAKADQALKMRKPPRLQPMLPR